MNFWEFLYLVVTDPNIIGAGTVLLMVFGILFFAYMAGKDM